jgi:hypothetical protein
MFPTMANSPIIHLYWKMPIIFSTFGIAYTMFLELALLSLRVDPLPL